MRLGLYNHQLHSISRKQNILVATTVDSESCCGSKKPCNGASEGRCIHGSFLQFNNELNNANSKLAEEVETSANAAEQHRKATQQATDLAQALALSVDSCRKQKIACRFLKQKLEGQKSTCFNISKERDVAYAQVCKWRSFVR